MTNNHKHTPGPWYWEVSGKTIRLFTPKNGHCIVMDFVRCGTQGAQPRFSDRGSAPLGGVMIKASEMKNIYNNPDARLIASAPDLLDACEKVLAYIIESGVGNYPGDMDAANTLKAAIAKALPEEERAQS
jgi:hypothetical protein